LLTLTSFHLFLVLQVLEKKTFIGLSVGVFKVLGNTLFEIPLSPNHVACLQEMKQRKVPEIRDGLKQRLKTLEQTFHRIYGTLRLVIESGHVLITDVEVLGIKPAVN
jgi:hypothetical protein